jgi:hypothetical protein
MSSWNSLHELTFLKAQGITRHSNSTNKVTQGDLVSHSWRTCWKLILVQDSVALITASDSHFDPPNVRLLWMIPLALAAAWTGTILAQVPTHEVLGTTRDAGN